MSFSFRQFAVSGSVAVAVVGGAAAVTAASAPAASAAHMNTVAERALTAPVNLPDGRTVRVVGLGGYGHRATPEHVVTVAAQASSTDPGGITTGVSPDSGSPLVNPLNQQPASNQQQVVTQASGGAIGVGVAAILVLGIVVFFKIKHGHIKAMDATIVALLGISLAGTVVGTMGHQITTSLVGSLGGVLGGL
ncbi:hypothetical protein [Streptomyces sp. SID10815]|uniref:hypothetical protein n=1 Tax=Streptomyces sp. SID10815 TaxID=2706027 RepID=UPI0013C67933|nr:hypothetical protein [Streptomyces sp. SID10815]NEA52397.1 hypothetical protein [Streptomyces sp. SID10815]